MANDDYFKMVYKILAYLYTQLKNGADIDSAMVAANSPLLKINERYWTYIIENLQREQLIRNVVVSRPWGAEPVVTNLERIQITPEGIAFLMENSLMEKTKTLLKEAKEIIPFV